MFGKLIHYYNFGIRISALPSNVWLTRQRIADIFAEKGDAKALSFLFKNPAEFSDALVFCSVKGVLEAKSG